MAKKTAPQPAAPSIRKTRTVDADNVKIAEHALGHLTENATGRQNAALQQLQRFLESAQYRTPSACDWSNLLATVAKGLEAATIAETMQQAMPSFNFAVEAISEEVK